MTGPVTTLAPPEDASPPISLELEIPPAAARRVARLLGVKGRRGRPHSLVWYDGPAFELVDRGLALAQLDEGRASREGARWRVFALRHWAGAPESPRSEAGDPELIAEELPAGLRPVATFKGTWRVLSGIGLLAPGIVVEILKGRIAAGERAEPCCRVRLAGPAASVEAAARRLAEALPAQAAGRALAEAALTLAGAGDPRAEEASVVTVGETFLRLLAGLAATLVLLAPEVGPQDEEPVHQMRVALRRLRSALRLFRRAAGGAELEAVDRRLRELTGLLAPAREWDVFLGTIGRDLVAALPDNPGVARLLAAAEQRRRRVYAALGAHLAGPRFRGLGVELALLAARRPWEREGGEAPARLAAPIRDFARHVLSRRQRPLLAAARGSKGGDVADWPVDELHALRLDGKRMRYAVEFFAPLFPGAVTRRMVRRLAVLQEALGRLHDGAVSSALLAELGLAEGYAGGLVAGLAAADAQQARAEISRAWQRLQATEAFWK